MLEKALGYVKAGFPIIPLCWPIDGKCGCGRGHEGRNIGKVPLTEHGLKDATTTILGVKEYWTKWPRANIGVVIPPEYFVLDVDVAHDGYDSLDKLQEGIGELPKTLAITTGSGGTHLWYKTDQPIKNTTKLAGYDGLDIRGTGGYVVSPPSLHSCGLPYQKSPLWSGPITLAPRSLIELCLQRIPQGNSNPDRPIVDGERNDTLARDAGAMRRRGFSEEAIIAALLIKNSKRCQPPLPESEVDTIAKSISQYPPEVLPKKKEEYTIKE